MRRLQILRKDRDGKEIKTLMRVCEAVFAA